MHDSIIKGAPLSPWKQWLNSAPGLSALAWEKTQFDELVGDVFGYYAVQLGLPEVDSLQMNRMPSRILASTEWLDAPGWPGYVNATEPAAPALNADPRPGSDSARGVAFTHRLVVDNFEDLPFAEQSLDLIVLPHVLEFAVDPHRVLREVDRVLRPDGRVVISGLNPISLWGARHMMPRQLMAPFLPPQAHFIGLPRLRDWFKLLSFDFDRSRYGCYSPPCRSQVWLDRMRFLEKAGDRWWPICGGVYVISAVKRVQGIRLIPPVWRTKESPRRRVAVVASSNQSQQSIDRDG